MTNPSHEHIASETSELLRGLESKGHKARIVPIERLRFLEQKMTEWHDKNLIGKELYEKYRKDFVIDFPAETLNTKSIIVVASPQPDRRVWFTMNEKVFSALIPYQYSRETDAEVTKILNGHSLSQNPRFAKAALPLKMLAVSSGLAEYGKNNIAYVKGMGSYLRLSAFYSDLPAATDIWRELRMMERCRRCSFCLKSCPARAIRPERFLLYAERCITFHNEGKQGFPVWLQPSWHNCLVGCLTCQKGCPENRASRDRIEDSWTFSREETSSIMNGEPVEKLPGRTIKKLEELGILVYYDILPRNLGALLAKKAPLPDKGS